MPRTHKKARKIAFPCRVCSQECLMEEESPQCDGCECWLHQHCIGMCCTQYVNFGKQRLQFFCRQCIGSGDGFNLLSSLSLAPDVGKMKAQAESEMNLLQFYCSFTWCCAVMWMWAHTSHLPNCCVSTVVGCWNSTFLHMLVATATVFFHAVSLPLYVTEEAYCLLCLLVTIETLLHPDLYDKDVESYYAPYKAHYHRLNSEQLCTICLQLLQAEYSTTICLQYCCWRSLCRHAYSFSCQCTCLETHPDALAGHTGHADIVVDEAGQRSWRTNGKCRQYLVDLLFLAEYMQGNSANCKRFCYAYWVCVSVVFR